MKSAIEVLQYLNDGWKQLEKLPKWMQEPCRKHLLFTREKAEINFNVSIGFDQEKEEFYLKEMQFDGIL